ncbi:MAG: hypothetical protein MJ221_01905 [Bacilli bacterium]|nr:hypothetical protein [Bacilli bacterium]
MYSIARLKAEDRKALFDAYSFQYRESPEIVERKVDDEVNVQKYLKNLGTK